jgi:hypothetical protein
MKDLQVVLATFPEAKGKVDIGHTDEHLMDVKVRVTPKYMEWLKGRGGRDVSMMLPSMSGGGAFSSTGAAKFGVQHLLQQTVRIVQNLLEAGVPEDVALGLLPYEIVMMMRSSDVKE